MGLDANHPRAKLDRGQLPIADQLVDVPALAIQELCGTLWTKQ
jgi:hypothetical protein